MITICSKHDEAIEIAKQKFYRGRLDSFEKEELIEIIEDMERYYSDIVELIEEAKKMGQKMEDGLRHRKEFMIEYEIETLYKS